MPETCSFPKQDGKTCGMTVDLLPGADGKPLCAWHDPARASARRTGTERAAAPPAPPLHPALADLPVQRVESLEDAEVLARWAMIEVTTGGLAPRAYQALVTGIKEYRMVLADSGVLKRYQKLIEQMERDAAEFADLRRRVAVAKERGIEV